MWGDYKAIDQLKSVFSDTFVSESWRNRELGLYIYPNPNFFFS